MKTLIIIAVAVLAAAALYGFLTRRRNQNTASHLSGGATMAKATDVDTVKKENNLPPSPTALRLGKIIEDDLHGKVKIGATVYADDDRSMLIVGNTGSGKTTTQIIPAALNHPGILLTTSVKGELAQLCFKARARRGNVSVVDPAETLTDPVLVDHRKVWTPLQSSKEYGAAVEVSDLLIKAGNSGEQNTWTESATSLLGVLLWTTAQFPGTSMLDLMSLLGALRGAKEVAKSSSVFEDELLSDVDNSVEGFSTFKDLVAYCAGHTEGGWAALEAWLLWAYENGRSERSQAKESPRRGRNKVAGVITASQDDAQAALSDFGALAAIAAAKETAAGVIFSLNGSLRQIKSSWAVASAKHDDPRSLIDLRRWAGSAADSVFVVAPDASEPLRGYFSAFLAMAVRALDREAVSRPGEKLGERALMLLDELANICPVPHLSNWLSTKRSQRISFLIALQSLSQLQARYGKEEAAVIVDNCAALQMLLPGSTDQETLDHFANKTGEYLHIQEQISVATSKGESWEAGLTSSNNRNKNKGESRTVSEQTTWRPLAQPAALRELRKDQAVCFVSGRFQNKFMKVQTKPYYEDERLKSLVKYGSETPSVKAEKATVSVESEFEF